MEVYLIFKICVNGEKPVRLHYMAFIFRDLKRENRLCTSHIFCLSLNVTLGLLSFVRRITADNIISHSLNAAVVLQQLYWLLGADLGGDF